MSINTNYFSHTKNHHSPNTIIDDDDIFGDDWFILIFLIYQKLHISQQHSNYDY